MVISHAQFRATIIIVIGKSSPPVFSARTLDDIPHFWSVTNQNNTLEMKNDFNLKLSRRFKGWLVCHVREGERKGRESRLERAMTIKLRDFR